MKVLYLKWESFGSDYVEVSIQNAGHEIVYFDFPRKTEDTRYSEELAGKLAMELIGTACDVIFSLNYFPVAAVAAAACKKPYISWTYDSPYIQLYSKTIDFPTNYAFVFDEAEYLNMVSKGIKNVYFMPMAAAVDYYDGIEISSEERTRFDADIAMIGSMYSEKKHDLIRHFKGLDEHTRGYVDGLLAAQSAVYGVNLIESGLTADIVESLRKVCPITAHGDGYENIEWTIANYFLARYLTKIERANMINLLSEKYNLALYTPEATPDFKVDNRGTVDYYKDFPKAVKCAKINLNITLRSIGSGIPLRAMDILGCGGFLLTNYQADFEKYFVNGQDYVYFESPQDLVEKAGYYLEHEDERIKIAASGHEKMKQLHTYDIRIKQMFSMINS